MKPLPTVLGAGHQAGPMSSSLFRRCLRVARGSAPLWLTALFVALGAGQVAAQRTVLLGPTVTNTVWRYDTNGTELHGTGWESPNFDDSTWPQGQALLAVENNAAIVPLIRSPLSLFLPGSTTVRVTSYWFRVHFNLPFDPAPLGSTLSLVASNHVDDGCVMYLNGVEVDRFNMPGIPGQPDILASTMAVQANPPAEPVRTNRNLGNPSSLVIGDNVLAVEVHQAGDASSDVVWGCTLVALVEFAPRCVDPTQPADTTVMQCGSFTLASAFDGAPAPTFQWFKDGAPIPGATGPSLTVSNAQLADAGVYEVEATNPLGSDRCRAARVTVIPDTTAPTVVSVVAGGSGTNVVITFSEPMDLAAAQDNFNYAILPAPALVPLSATLVNPSTVVLHLEPPLLDCTGYTLNILAQADACGGNPMPTPTSVPFVKPLLLLAIDDAHQWRYEESGTDLGTAWRSPLFDDSAWPSGPALLGLEGGGLPEPIRTPLTISNTKTTFYFRTHFTLPTDPSLVTRLRLRQVLDDGAVYWLNGSEVFRSRIAAGPVNFATLAVNQPVDPAQYEGPFDLPLAPLRCGDNVLAVEVHQSSAGSSDVVMGAELVAEVAECRPCPPRVAILDFQPREGVEGTLVTIQGRGFHGGSPDDHCAVLMKGNRFIDFEVLNASPTQLVARVGVIPPDCFGPLQLMVAAGAGARIPLCPQDRDVQVGPDNWVWRGLQADAAVAPGNFVAVQALAAGLAGTPGTPARCNFHSPPIMAGMLSVVINKDWGPGRRFCISGRIHAEGTGADTRIGPATFTLAGSRFDCARKICDLLVQAFTNPPPANPPSPPLNILCQVTTNASGDALITIWLANGVLIESGNLDITEKDPPPVIAGLWDFRNGGIWRREIRAHEIARWYRHYTWVTRNSIWFERRAEGLWITREALETYTCRSHCIYRFPNGRIWVIWRTFSRTDLRRFWAHYRFWWPGRLNPNLAANDPLANRTMMSMDELQMVLPMTPQDPNPATPFNEGVQIMDENGQMHFQGQPGFEVMPDIAGNPNGFQLATTAHSTAQLPPAADRIQDLPMPPMPGMAQLQPGVIIQWLVDRNGNVLVDHNNDGWPDPLQSPFVLGAQKHQGLIAPPTGVAGTDLPVDFGNAQPQLFCWELDENGEIRGAAPGQMVVDAPVDINLDGLPDGPIGGPVAMDPTVRMPQIQGGNIVEVRNENVAPVDIAVEEEGPPTDAQLAALNANLAAQLGPGFVPLQRPFILCIRKIKVRQWWGIDRRVVFDTWRHHWTWHHRNHIVLRHRACRVWLTKISVSHFQSKHHHYVTWPTPHATWNMFSLTHVRFLRVCYRVIVTGPNQVLVKIDQMHVVVPNDPADPNSRLMLLSTQSDENRLFQEVPPAVLAGLQPDPLPVGPDGVFVEPIDPVAGTLDIGQGGTGIFGNRPLEAQGMLPAVLGGNADAPDLVANNQLQLYCWQLNPNGTIASETFPLGPGFAPAAPGALTFAISPAPAIPEFVDDEGNAMDNPTMFETTLTSVPNDVRVTPVAGGNFELSWEGPGHLECANVLLGNGPPTVWIDVPGGALSPVTVPGNAPQRFYRVQRQ